MVSIGLLYFSTSNLNIQNYNTNLEFNGNNAYNYVQDQLDIGYRIPGTQERINCTEYFISKFKEIDINFSNILHNFTVDTIDCQNILFKLNENQSNIVILGAHYDSRAKATKDPIIANRNNPVPGANDGASGSAVLIELANVFFSKHINLSCQIWFLFFDAEDQGRDNGYGIDGWNWCEGSQKFVSEIDNFYDSETENIECMILLDMVGGDNLKFINEQISTSSLLNELFTIGRQLGYTVQFPSNPESASIVDDHRAFINIGIPSADLIINFWANPDWSYHHTTEDDLSHISEISLEITGKTVEQFIYNNYIDDPDIPYQGNYPWSQDTNMLSKEIIIIIIIIGSFIGIVVLIQIAMKKISSKELDKNKNKTSENNLFLNT
ncbi:MAG: M28 family peptidase [Promethearchaeota archaeon]